jgi:hypothetical protein
MTQRPKGQGEGSDADPSAHAASPAGLWDDWVTIWQSEVAAMATDREAQAVFCRLVAVWADGARAMGAWLPDGEARRAGTVQPQGAAAAAAAPDARDLALERLARRVEELEQRLGGLDRGKPEP